ncbi:MAG: PorT family protein [Bacteroidales bacterium]|nr:PorT family protein [Bacteroidales bacterium]
MPQKHTIYRKLLILMLLFAISGASFAQKGGFGVPNLQKYDKKRFHFGFSIGYNLFDFNLKSNAYYPQSDSLLVINTKAVSGFSLGIVTNLRIWKYFDLRFIPGLSFGERVLNYEFAKRVKDDDKQRRIESVYLDLPLLFKIKSSRMHNVRVYVIGGVQYSIDLISNQKKQSKRPNEMLVKLNKNDLQGQVGFGLDFYCTYFKLTTEIKMGFGMLNLLVHENHIYTSNISSVKSKTLQVSVIFE